MKFIKEKNGFKSYKSEDGFKVYYGIKGAVSGDNDINPEETICLISGKIKVIIGDIEDELSAPVEIKILAKTYHKIEALSDVVFLVFEK